MRIRPLLTATSIVLCLCASIESNAAPKKDAGPGKAPRASAPAPSAAPVITRTADVTLAPHDDAILLRQARYIFGELPQRMPGAEADTPDQIELGRRLYFENALSADSKQSCNSCHNVEGINGGADTRPTSVGATGKLGGRNSPGVLNAGFQLAQFWDGRAPDLAAQAKGPVLNPVEMAVPDEHTAMKQLAAAGYEPLFRTAFPGDPNPFTFDNMANAIAAFERTLVSRSRFDRYVAGDTTALSPLEKRGLAEYINVGCERCHNSPLFGGMLYQQLGIAHPYPTSDTGRAQVTKNPADNYVFKVPLLRNVVITGPYFHTGDVATVAQAVDLMGWHQLDMRLSNEQIDVITRFLTALSDSGRLAAPATASKAPARWAVLPIRDASPDSDAALVRYGYDLVTDTHRYLGAHGLGLAGNAMACRNCHQESGTKAYGVPWVGVASRYPRVTDRSGKMTTLEDRINDCMQRSMNGKKLADGSREMRAIVAYMKSLSMNVPPENVGLLLVKFEPPDRRANVERGRAVYAAVCQNCHGATGEGYRASAARGLGYVVPPLGGPGAYNDGAGTARVLTATALIHANMPLGATWDHPQISISDAYDVAAFINSFERPGMPGKENDYPDRMKKPIDAPYGPYADPFSADQHKYGPFRPIAQWYEEHGGRRSGGRP